MGKEEPVPKATEAELAAAVDRLADAVASLQGPFRRREYRPLYTPAHLRREDVKLLVANDC